MGQPKALVGTWLVDAVQTLRTGGCTAVSVVLGAQAEQARALLASAEVDVVVAEDWGSGMAVSLVAGLAALDAMPARSALVHLVDLPDVTATVVRRVLASGDEPTVLARATYDGAPGHPVLLGRDHWAPIRDQAEGDRGAGPYLARHLPSLVECGDLATGLDVDRPG